ncbi:hypothetical protein IWX46DRAFT_607753 [Phyllosticta citricarpa]|uniref:Uncharacterized protein n=1 Tax=Phyllosticta citricarpa TaxID=55181 RepID=A0ABR1LV07_9PEZI
MSAPSQTCLLRQRPLFQSRPMLQHCLHTQQHPCTTFPAPVERLPEQSLAQHPQPTDRQPTPRPQQPVQPLNSRPPTSPAPSPHCQQAPTNKPSKSSCRPPHHRPHFPHPLPPAAMQHAHRPGWTRACVAASPTRSAVATPRRRIQAAASAAVAKPLCSGRRRRASRRRDGSRGARRQRGAR